MDDFEPVTITSLLRVAHSYNGSILPPSPGDFNVMHWNINHLTNKLDDLELVVASYPGLLHAVAISETCLRPENSPMFQLPNYTAFHNVRHSNGGGVSLFIHDSLCDTSPNVLADITTSELHHFLVIDIVSIKTTLAIPYIRPDGNTNAFLADLQNLCLEQRNCLVMGDFNMNQLDTKKHEVLMDILESNDFGLLNAILEEAKTRSISGTILDLAATNMLNHQYKVSIIHNDMIDTDQITALFSLRSTVDYHALHSSLQLEPNLI